MVQHAVDTQEHSGPWEDAGEAVVPFHTERHERSGGAVEGSDDHSVGKGPASNGCREE